MATKPVGRIIITAGHHLKDSGAAANGFVERDEAINLKNKVVAILVNTTSGIGIQTDDDKDTLSQVIKNIETNERCVCIDLHFDAAGPTAHGTTVVVPERHTVLETKAAKLLLTNVSDAAQSHPRGVIVPSQTPRKTIGILQYEQGVNLLLEVCFITSNRDMGLYKKHEDRVAKAIAETAIEIYYILNPEHKP